MSWLDAVPAPVAEVQPWTPADLHAPGARGDTPAGPPAPTEAELLEQRAEELEQVRQDAFAAGDQAGWERRGRDMQREVEQAVRALESATGACRTSMETWSGTLEGNLVALATAAARHIVEREVRQDPAIVTALIRRAMATFPPDQRIRVRMNPGDLSALAGAGSDGRTLVPHGREVEWIADADILTGGCMVEGPESVLDGRVDTALERLYWSLVE